MSTEHYSRRKHFFFINSSVSLRRFHHAEFIWDDYRWWIELRLRGLKTTTNKKIQDFEDRHRKTQKDTQKEMEGRQLWCCRWIFKLGTFYIFIQTFIDRENSLTTTHRHQPHCSVICQSYNDKLDQTPFKWNPTNIYFRTYLSVFICVLKKNKIVFYEFLWIWFECLLYF